MTETGIVLPELPELTFDPGPHIYRLNGEEIPSVSRLMEPLKAVGYAGVDEKVLERAAQRGTAVHEAIENYCKYGIEDIPPQLSAYFDAFLEWNRIFKPKVIGSEIMMYHKILRYGGTIDVLAEVNEELTLIDVKTTSKLLEKSCGVQLEAYAQALASHDIFIQRKRILHLMKNGKWAYPEFPAKDAERWRVLGALKTIYDYERN